MLCIGIPTGSGWVVNGECHWPIDMQTINLDQRINSGGGHGNGGNGGGSVYSHGGSIGNGFGFGGGGNNPAFNRQTQLGMAGNHGGGHRGGNSGNSHSDFWAGRDNNGNSANSYAGYTGGIRQAFANAAARGVKQQYGLVDYIMNIIAHKETILNIGEWTQVIEHASDGGRSMLNQDKAINEAERRENVKRKAIKLEEQKIATEKAAQAYEARVLGESEILKDEPLLSPDMRLLVADALLDVKAGQDKIKAIEKLKAVYEKAMDELEPAVLKAQQEKDTAEKASNEAQKEPAREDGFEYSRREYDKFLTEQGMKDKIKYFKDKEEKIVFDHVMEPIKDALKTVAIPTIGIYLLTCPNHIAKATGWSILGAYKINDFIFYGDGALDTINDATQLRNEQLDYYNSLPDEEHKELYNKLLDITND